MSQRAHFWLRIAGITVILAAQFGPRLLAAAFADDGSAQSSPPVAAAARAAR
jgi:hypothetical protein